MGYGFYLLIVLVSLQYYGQNFNSQWFNTNNQLPQNSIKDIVKDNYGFIWIATDNGILRYDGLNFNKFDINLKDSHFRVFKGNIKKDSIFILNSFEKECLLLHKRKISRHSISPQLLDVRKAYGQLYFAFQKTDLSKNDYSSLSRYFIEVTKGDYLFSKNFIIYRDRETAKEQTIHLPFDPVDMKNVFCHGDVVFFADSKRNKLFRLVNGVIEEQYAPSIYTDPETKIYWEKINDQVFLVKNGDILISNYTNKLNTKKLLTYPDFGKYRFHSIYFDKEFNSLYLGSLTKGLNILTPFKINCAQNTLPYQNNVQYASLPFENSKVVNPYGEVFSHSSFLLTLHFGDHNRANSMVYDDTENILCINENKIFRYLKGSNYKTKSSVTFNGLLLNIFKVEKKYFLSVERDKQFFLFIYDDDQFKKPKAILKLKTPVTSVLSYGATSSLISTREDMFIFDSKNKDIDLINTPKINIKKLCKTTDGSMWVISMANGIFLLKNKTFIRMPLDASQHLSSSHDMLEDKNGSIWISTNNGLYKTRKEDLLNYAKTGETPVHYYRFDSNDGTCSNEFNGAANPCAQKLSSGEFVFPTMDGFVFFKPEKVKCDYPKPNEIFIERAKADNLAIKYFQNIAVFPRNIKKIVFFVDLPYYTSKDNLLIEFKDAKSDTWVKINSDRTISMENLPVGKHEYLVRVLINGKGKYYYKRLYIHIPPLIYQTPLFKVFLVIIGIIGILYYIGLKTNKLRRVITKQRDKITCVENKLLFTEEKLQKEAHSQEDFFQAVTHDISTPIKHLSDLSHMLYNTKESALQKKYFEEVYKSSGQLYNLIGSLKEYRDVFNEDSAKRLEPSNLHDLISSKINLFLNLASYKQTSFSNKIPTDLMVNINKSILSIIFQNILDNAVKNTHSGTISISAVKVYDTTYINISDTGCGMKIEKLNYYNQLYKELDNQVVPKRFGLGLHLVIRLLKKINADIEFSLNKPIGTIITIKLKDYVQ